MSKRVLFLFLCFSLWSKLSHSQEIVRRELTLNEVIEMALKNHQQLKIARAKIDLNEQQTQVSKLQRLPDVSFSASAFYLSNVLLLNPDFSKVTTVSLPHFGNSFAMQTSQLLYKGGVVNKSIEMNELQIQLAELDLEKDKQDVKFLITSHYLDIYKIQNQIVVYNQNKTLAEQRLANVKKLYEQDMVTRNEVIRAELQIKNLEQTILSLNNNHIVLSNRLSYALGLPENVLIIPVEHIKKTTVETKKDYLNSAYFNHPSLKSANKNIELAKKNVGIVKTDRLPSISAFAGYNMQRPLTTSTPALDLYSNTWQAGISLSYNIANLYKTKQKVRLAELQTDIFEESFTLTEQNIYAEVNAAYIKYQESLQQAELSNEAKKLANENYRIIEARYLNQLAITAEMTDAATAKLDAELQYANAEINVLFQYYNLLKATGML